MTRAACRFSKNNSPMNNLERACRAYCLERGKDPDRRIKHPTKGPIYQWRCKEDALRASLIAIGVDPQAKSESDQ